MRLNDSNVVFRILSLLILFSTYVCLPNAGYASSDSPFKDISDDDLLRKESLMSTYPFLKMTAAISSTGTMAGYALDKCIGSNDLKTKCMLYLGSLGSIVAVQGLAKLARRRWTPEQYFSTHLLQSQTAFNQRLDGYVPHHEVRKSLGIHKPEKIFGEFVRKATQHCKIKEDYSFFLQHVIPAMALVALMKIECSDKIKQSVFFDERTLILRTAKAMGAAIIEQNSQEEGNKDSGIYRKKAVLTPYNQKKTQFSLKRLDSGFYWLVDQGVVLSVPADGTPQKFTLISVLESKQLIFSSIECLAQCLAAYPNRCNVIKVFSHEARIDLLTGELEPAPLTLQTALTTLDLHETYSADNMPTSDQLENQFCALLRNNFSTNTQEEDEEDEVPSFTELLRAREYLLNNVNKG